MWSYAPNLIHVKPYHFFRHTGDINAPPGLTKQDDDDKLGIDFEKDKLADKSTENNSKSKPVMKLVDNFLGSLAADDLKLSEDDEDIPEKKDESVIIKPIATNNISDDLMLTDSDEETDSKDTKESSKTSKNTAEKEEEACEGDREESEDEDETKKSNSTIAAVVASTKATLSEKVNDSSENETEKTSEPAAEESGYANEKAGKKDLDDEKAKIASPIAEEKCEDVTSVSTSKTNNNEPKLAENTMLAGRYEDDDDYLIYLENILHSIHEAFYSLYDEIKSTRPVKKIPDVKEVIPYVRKKVLKVKQFFI